MAKPDYAVWDLIEDFTPAQAAYLWLELEPEDTSVWASPPKIQAIGEQIMKETGSTENPNLRHARRKVTRDELRALANTLNTSPPFLFPDRREKRGSHDVDLSQSSYWCELERMAETAVQTYPDWRKTERSVKKTGNLHRWLTKVIGTDNREAEILKKVLSDIFKELS